MPAAWCGAVTDSPWRCRSTRRLRHRRRMPFLTWCQAYDGLAPLRLHGRRPALREPGGVGRHRLCGDGAQPRGEARRRLRRGPDGGARPRGAAWAAAGRIMVRSPRDHAGRRHRGRHGGRRSGSLSRAGAVPDHLGRRGEQALCPARDHDHRRAHVRGLGPRGRPAEGRRGQARLDLQPLSPPGTASWRTPRPACCCRR